MVELKMETSQDGAGRNGNQSKMALLLTMLWLCVLAIDDAVVVVRCGHGWGSGVVVDSESGTIITCSHAVASVSVPPQGEMTRSKASTSPVSVHWKGKTLDARLVFRTRDGVAFDVAVLDVGPNSGLREVSFDKDPPHKGSCRQPSPDWPLHYARKCWHRTCDLLKNVAPRVNTRFLNVDRVHEWVLSKWRGGGRGTNFRTSRVKQSQRWIVTLSEARLTSFRLTHPENPALWVAMEVYARATVHHSHQQTTPLNDLLCVVAGGRTGDQVVAAGFPLFSERDLPYLLPTITRGVVSHVAGGGSAILHTTCCVQSGASGGAVLRLGDGLPLRLVALVACNIQEQGSGALFPHVNLAVPATVMAAPLAGYRATRVAFIVTDKRVHFQFVVRLPRHALLELVKMVNGLAMDWSNLGEELSPLPYWQPLRDKKIPELYVLIWIRSDDTGGYQTVLRRIVSPDDTQRYVDTHLLKLFSRRPAVSSATNRLPHVTSRPKLNRETSASRPPASDKVLICHFVAKATFYGVRDLYQSSPVAMTFHGVRDLHQSSPVAMTFTWSEGSIPIESGSHDVSSLAPWAFAQSAQI
uniref:Peroxisomal leader peptide-processing protease n=1 Tax=Timema tahoe TaxID=61484 RepID=A0A7R9NX46_9NEOP|nr:unnamed protein product [Timema tahoe]